MQHRALNDFVAVADERAPRFGASLERKLNTLGNAHVCETFQQRLTLAQVRLSFERGFGESAVVNRRAAEFMQLRFLLGGNGGAVFEGAGQRGRSADAVKLLHQSLDALGREMPHHVN